MATGSEVLEEASVILPNVRASFGPTEVEILLRLLCGRALAQRRDWERRLLDDGIESVLDDPRTLSAVMDSGGIAALSPKLTFYVMVRHTLLESGLDDPNVADYVAALLIEFAAHGRPYRIARYDDKTYRYLVELLTDLEDEGSPRRRFLLRAHIGNYALWLSGMFPDFVIARVHRKGAPGFLYYEDLGASGYLMASESELAGRYDLAGIYRHVADRFRAVRRALNIVSDRYVFPRYPAPIDRLLRQTVDKVDSKSNSE